MKQYDNRFVVAVLICLKEIIFHISSYLNFCVCKYTNFLFSTVGRNIAANDRGLLFGGAKSQFPLAYRYRLLIYISFPVHFEPPLIANRCYGFGGLFVNQYRQFCADGRNFNQGFSFLYFVAVNTLFSEFATVSQK